jgi:flagellin-like hook-associated protein FlgL
LSQTRVPGSQVFGALSQPVGAGVNLDPSLTFQTALSDLHLGQGVDKGSIAIFNGTHTSIVDISGANTIGDVANLIRNNPPAGSALDVQVTSQGLQIQLDPSSGAGNLTVTEVGDGTTAHDLGIYNSTGVGNTPLVGSALDPQLTLTTPLDDILGTQAQAVVPSPGGNSDIVLQAQTAGSQYNGATIAIEGDPTVTAGQETVSYNAATMAIVVHVAAGQTTTQQVVTALNNANAAGTIPFTASLDPVAGAGNGLAIIGVTPNGQVAATTSGGGGQPLDQTSGLQIVNGGSTYNIDVSQCKSVQDLLNAIDGAGAGMLAQINQAGTGIQVQSRLSGCDFSIGENGGTTATQLGLRTLSADTPLSELNYGQGVSLGSSSGTAASATYGTAGDDNGLVLTAKNGGQTWNGYQVNFVDSGGAAGSESVSCDTQAKTITFSIVPGSTTANTLVSLVQNSPSLSQYFSLGLDQTQASNDGTGLVAVGSTTTAGGSNTPQDFTITRADGVSMTIDLSGCQTVGDVLNAINDNSQNTPAISGGPPALVAKLSPQGNGIQLVDNSIGSGQLTVTQASGSGAAVGLGLIPAGQTSQSSSAAGTVASATVTSAGANNGLVFSSNSDTFGNGWQVVFQNTANPPSLNLDTTNKVMTFDINAGTTTANDVISMLDANPQASADFSVSLSSSGGANDGTGLVADNTADPAVLSGGTPQTLTGSDSNPQEVDGLFTALARLQDGLSTNNTQEITRGVSLLDAAVTQLNFVQADVGAKQQGLTAQATNLTNQTTQLQSNLSTVQNVDMTQVITALTAEQAAFQGSLEATGQIFKLTLLNYL